MLIAIFKSHNKRIDTYFLNNFAQNANCQSSHHSMKIQARGRQPVGWTWPAKQSHPAHSPFTNC